MIIDDEPYILDIFSHFLAFCGFNVQSATNTDDAIQYLKNNSFDLVLLDVYLKSGDFGSFLNYFKDETGLKSDIPVIAVTGEPDSINQDQHRFLKGVLEKPFTPDELITFISAKMNWKLA